MYSLFLVGQLKYYDACLHMHTGITYLILYTLMFCYCHAFLIQDIVYEYSSVLSLVIISLQCV